MWRIAIAALVYSASTALAQSPSSGWVTIDTAPDHFSRINVDRIRRESATVIDVWDEVTFTKEQAPVLPGWPKWVRRHEDNYIDCQRVQTMLVSALYYRADSSGTGSFTPPAANRSWRPAPPGSLDELIANRACALAPKK